MNLCPEILESIALRQEAGRAEVAPRTPPSISVVVPVYNSGASLPILIQRLEPVLASLSEEYEAVLVNDGSRDGSWGAIEKLSRRYSWVRGINLRRNYGQHNAVLCGIRRARCETIVTMDDDLQNPPEEMPKLLSELGKGYDVVYGAVPAGRQGLWRELASHITRWVLRRAMQVQAANQVSAYRALRAPVCRTLAKCQSPFVSIDVLLSWATNRFSAVPVRQEAREFGSSNYSFSKLVVHALTMMTGFSTWPLRLASVVGFGFTAFGILMFLYVVGRYFVQGGSVPGFPFLASAIAIFSGAQLFALGIIGEYLGRLYYRVMERPAYVIGEIVETKAGDGA